ncbi:MAG: insulinase family protein [Ferruginibacter sp.]
MNKILCLLISAAISLNVSAQVDRSKAPAPGPAPVIEFKDPVTFTLPNGMTVLVVENHKFPKVRASFSIDMGPVKEGNKAGLLDIMGGMLSEGTKSMSKAKFDEEVDVIGADVALYAGGAYTSALTRYFNKAFLLMADALKNPAFPQESFDKLKTQAITGIKSSEKSASAIAGRVGSALSYGKNTAMGEFPTEESIAGLTLADIKDAYKNYITPYRSYLTFVGDITPGAAKTLALQAFGSWTGKKLTLPVITPAENVKTSEINFVDVPNAVQGEVIVSNLVNNPMSNPDYHALLIANQILGGGSESKLFMNLREKHGFTYGSYSNIGAGRFQNKFSATAQVRSEKADSAVAEIMSEINNMRTGNITPEELEIAKAKYNGSFALGMEDPARAATYATNIIINNLPKDFYRTYLQKINAVSALDIQKVANKYFNKDKSRIVIVGNASKILPNLARLGYPIKQYDKYANPVVEKKEEAASNETPKTTEAISAASLVDSYLKALGGKEEVKKINSIKMEFTMDLMGQTFNGIDVKMAPNKHAMELKMGEMKVMNQMFDGAKGYQAQMGQKKDMDADEIKEALDDKAIIPQLFYITNDYGASYLGTDKTAGEGAYKLKITKPSGKTSIEYYSIKTGLLLKEETTLKAEGQEIPQTIEYSNYKKVGNLTLPFTITQSIGEQEMTMNVTSITINKDVTEADFK